MNARPVDVLRGDAFLPTPWRDVRVGDVVRVRDRDAFPADLVLLSSSATGRGGGGGGSGDSGSGGGEASSPSADASSSPSAAGGADASSSLARSPSSSLSAPPSFPTGVAFVETANLDGETNLKMRQALPQTVGLLSAAAICRATTGSAGGASGAGSGGSGGGGREALASSSSSSSATPAPSSSPPSPRHSLLRIECEQPNSAIYRFQGVLVTPEGERLPLSPNQVTVFSLLFLFSRCCSPPERPRRFNKEPVQSSSAAFAPSNRFSCPRLDRIEKNKTNILIFPINSSSTLVRV